MMISKYSNKKNEECISIIVSSKELTTSKSNPNVFRITLSPNYDIHLDEKKKIRINELFHMEKLIDNSKK